MAHPTYTSTTSDEITIRTLNEATASLQIKSEVQSVLNTIISDIETTHQIETKLNHEYEVHHYQQRCQNAECALEEYKAIERERNQNARILVQEFVNDLGGLTGLMREMKLEQERVKCEGHFGFEENEHKVNEGIDLYENDEEGNAETIDTSNPATTINEISNSNEPTKKVDENETKESQATDEIKVTKRDNETGIAVKDTDTAISIPENEQNEPSPNNNPTIASVPPTPSSSTTIIKQK